MRLTTRTLGYAVLAFLGYVIATVVLDRVAGEPTSWEQTIVVGAAVAIAIAVLDVWLETRRGPR